MNRKDIRKGMILEADVQGIECVLSRRLYLVVDHSDTSFVMREIKRSSFADDLVEFTGYLRYEASRNPARNRDIFTNFVQVGSATPSNYGSLKDGWDVLLFGEELDRMLDASIRSKLDPDELDYYLKLTEGNK